MCEKFKYKDYQVVGSVSEVQYQWLKADAAERQLVLSLLPTIIEEQEGDGDYSWQGYELELVDGSSLYEVHMPGRAAWSHLANYTVVMDELRRHRPENMAATRINEAGGLEIFRKDSAVWEVVDVDIVHQSHYYQKLLVVGDIARQAGGYVYTEDLVDVEQWLKFHGLAVPRNASEVKNLIALFEFDPDVDELGNYWGQLVTDDPTLAVLSAEQRAAIREATPLVANNTKLLDKLYRETGRGFATHDNAAERMVQLVKHPVAQASARALLEALDWFGAQSGQDVSSQDLEQLLITSLLLDLYPTLGSTQERKSIGGFDLYTPTNVERSPALVREELQAFLHTKGWVDPAAAPLACHLLLAEIAPEFLVRGVPSALTMGSVSWVTFCHGVALAEAVRKGASRVLTYAQIMAYVELEPVSEPLSRLRDLAMIDPIVDWALMNGVISASELNQAAKETTEQAITAFQEYAENFTHLARIYSSPMPNRETMAREALQGAVPECDFLDDTVLYQRPGLYASPNPMSMVGLHMSGDLTGGQWDFRAVFPDEVISKTPDLHAGLTNYKRPTYYDPSVTSLYSRFPRLLRLPSNNAEYHRLLRDYHGNLNKALMTNVKLALSHMLPHDLDIFLKGKISFFTVRLPATRTESYFSISPVPISTTYETQHSNDAVKGRFGIVMCATHGNTAACYELFTLRGELRKNSTLASLIISTGKLRAAARLDFNGDLNAPLRPTPPESLPLSVVEYTDGVVAENDASSSMAIIEKLGEIPAPASVAARQQSTYGNFANPQLVRIAEFVVNNHPFRTFDEIESMATVPTALESERKRGEETADYIVNLVVPFKKCIEDLSSGEHNKVVDGIYGCVMDTIALGGAFVGAGAKALSISAKAISTTTKAARLTQLAFMTSVSLFNPVDDVPTVFYGAGKLIHKGALRFSRQAQELLGLAKSQLGRLHGTHKSYDLIRAANNLHTGQGNWRPRGAIGETLTVVAARNNFQWYALDRLGKAWGPKLNNFAYVAPVRLPRSTKTLPVSYTRQFIEQSLPRARTKIENAINALTHRDFEAQRKLVARLLMGSDSNEAINQLGNYLRAIRADFAGVSISNFLLDPLKDTHHIAAFDTSAYQQWKGATGPSDTTFIEIYTANLNRHFIGLGFNHDVVADDLIHELFHGPAQIGDVAYARDAGNVGGGQSLDVSALLNLASGQLAVTDEGDDLHASSKAFENADSLAVATSLLSQLYTDKGGYERNMALLQDALEANPDSAIGDPVLITLNNPDVTAQGAASGRPGASVG
ncbi:hypothetical protein K5R88_06685 [Pseudomonas sp. MM213]|uniref:hypothetical protein n=1 Tax=Pseudomonas sp. MM213 TaxID=2866807 RepID=UPI001CF0D9C3|nr:hypothetical protein [Pseudomonas sp. MM213]UCP11318.1 hypothetical protein K5R88_06685 [Pseudomonas sp. MM213]